MWVAIFSGGDGNGGDIYGGGRNRGANNGGLLRDGEWAAELPMALGLHQVKPSDIK